MKTILGDHTEKPENMQFSWPLLGAVGYVGMNNCGNDASEETVCLEFADI